MLTSTRLRPRHLHSAHAAGSHTVKPAAKSAAQQIGKSARPAEPVVKTGWGIYILCCADGTLYTGCTIDRDRRLRDHGKGQVKYTRGRLPVRLVHWEDSADKGAALRREAAVKRLPRQAKLALCGYAKLC